MTDSWVSAEFKSLELPDKRLNRRCIHLLEELAANPKQSIPTACGRAGSKAAYRFFGNDRVDPQSLVNAHEDSVLGRIAGQKLILAIQDTTSLDFTTRQATEGLGMLENKHIRGLMLHSCLAVSEQGLPLGLIEQKVWARDPKKAGSRSRRRKRPTAEKESQRWIQMMQSVQQKVPATTGVLMVADREADIYDLFAAPRREGSDLLVRAAHNRAVQEEQKYLWPTVRSFGIAGQISVSIPRADGRAERKAELSLRYGQVTLLPPRNRCKGEPLAEVVLSAVLVEEQNPPEGVEGICWLLLTTLAVGSLLEAVQCVRWYSLRWLIERYHFVLKSGCQIEQLELEKAKRLERALALYAIVAWRILWLTYTARIQPDEPCTKALEPEELQALLLVTKEATGSLSSVPTMREAVGMVAKLGGFLGRKGDGEPGVKTIWRGLRRLADMTVMYRVMIPRMAEKDVGNA